MLTSRSMEIEGLDALIALFEKLPPKHRENVTEIISKWTYKIDDEISNRVTDGKNDSLKARTGELRKSIRPRIKGRKNLDNFSAAVYTYSPYAPIHETGGTIRAKDKFMHLEGGPYLTVPSDQNKTPAGVTRMTPREAFSEGGFTIPLSGGKAKFAIMSSNNTPLYWLVNEVYIKPRLGFQETFKKYVPSVIEEITESVGKEAEKILKKQGYNR